MQKQIKRRAIGAAKICGVICLFTLQSCAQWFPAISTQLEPGTYQLVAYGNSFTSRDNLIKRITKKAEKLCSPFGFTYITPEKFSFDQQEVYMDGRMQSVSAFRLERTATCNNKTSKNEYSQTHSPNITLLVRHQ